MLVTDMRAKGARGLRSENWHGDANDAGLMLLVGRKAKAAACEYCVKLGTQRGCVW